MERSSQKWKLYQIKIDLAMVHWVESVYFVYSVYTVYNIPYCHAFVPKYTVCCVYDCFGNIEYFDHFALLFETPIIAILWLSVN